MSVPYIIELISLLICLGLAMFTRGARLIRTAMAFVMVATMPYVIMLALNGSVNDADLAFKFSKFGIGSVSFIGVALMMALLVIAGRFEDHRLLFAISLFIASVTAVVTWSSDLVVAGVWRTEWGFWFSESGKLADVHTTQFVLWTVVGIVLSRRSRSTLMTDRQRSQVRIIAGGLVLSLLAVSDALLARKIGVYPFSFIPSLIGFWVTIYAVLRHDLLQSQGFDRAGFYEALIVFALAAVVAAVFALASEVGGTWATPEATVLMLVPALLIAYVLAVMIRKRVTAGWLAEERDTDSAFDAFFDQASAVSSNRQLSDTLSALLTEHLELRDVQLYLQQESKLWASLADPDRPPVKLDARVRAWLMRSPTPLVSSELVTQQLGGLRQPIELFMKNIGAEVVVPMVDRAQIVGIVTATMRADQRALRDSEKAELMQAARAGARALTYIQLMREAQEKMEVVKEVEVATAVQQARAPGERALRFGTNEVVSHYQPSAQFGGHWWMCHELPDGRIMVVIGDVAGQGVSAALISFTVEGACETAHRMFGANFEALSLLQLLNQSVLDVGKGMYAMSCFVAVVDPAAGNVVFANAGHPFPYVCRSSASAKRGNAELRALVSRGTPLGTPDPVLAVSSMELESDDVLVFFSDSIVSSRNPEGKSYGDRRLQRVLRNKVRDAGARACDVIMHDATTFYGSQPIDEDLNLVVMRLGAH